MKILGITGGVGSGKSTVLDILKGRYGAKLCQLDEVARRLQRNGGACFEEIVERFGREVIGEDGELDRARLAQIVFSDERKLACLNDIVHPRVKEWIRQDILQKKQEGVTLYVIEAALLPTAGYETICDEMWYVCAEEAVRRRRLAASRGYPEEKISQMIQAQPDDAVFRAACTVVIDNSGEIEDTRRQVCRALEALSASATQDETGLRQ